MKTRTGLGRRGRGRTRTECRCEGLGKGAAPEDTSAQGSRSHDGAHGGQQRRVFYRSPLLGSEQPRGKRTRPGPGASTATADNLGTGKRRHDGDAGSPSSAARGDGKRLSSGLSLARRLCDEHRFLGNVVGTLHPRGNGHYSGFSWQLQSRPGRRPLGGER